MRISDWSSDVCSSDLALQLRLKFTCRRHPQNARRDDQGEMDLRASTSAAQGRTGPRSFRRPLLGWLTSTCIDDNDSIRSEERIVGKESCSQCRHRGWLDHNKKKNTN